MTQSGDQGATENPYLLGLVGSLTNRKFFLERGKQLVGRDAAGCQIVLEQAVVSRRHAEFETDERGRVTLTDVAGRQATFVNGAAITRRELEDGDLVGFGPSGVIAFSFHAPAPAGGSIAPATVKGATSRADELRARFANAAQKAATSKAAVRQPLATPPTSAAQPVTPAASHIHYAPAAEKPVVTIGRAPDNDIVLDAPGVSRHHATLIYNGGAQPAITDTGSTNGTFVNGEPLTEARPLGQHDLVFLGGFLLRVEGRGVRRHDLSASRITARQITKEIGGRTILKDVSLAFYPREFIGLMGPSGCGKSTLMDALNGLRPATTGSVLVNDLDLYRNFDALRRSIGYVPQRDILHDVLTVERTLFYTAKLRLPEATPVRELQRIVGEVIVTVGLDEHRTTQFRQLSGGQQKRLSLAVELITKPNFIFLDEPTSPLDPETTENMMMLFRRLADEGRIVVMVTHKFEKFDEMHQVAILTKGGRLAFYGPPREALDYFGCREPGEIYRRIAGREPEELNRAYHASPTYRKYVAGRIAETEELTRTSGSMPVGGGVGGGGGASGGSAERRFGFKQWLTLTERYLEMKLKDQRNTLLLLAQAPLIAAILALITGSNLNDPKTIFIGAIIAIWFGANNAVREIVSEVPIYTRERLVNLKIPSYVLSKFVVLSGIGLIQCALFVVILIALGCLSGGDFLSLTLILYFTLLAGVSMGLLFSAIVNSSEKAMSVLPLILIPQLLLGGFLKPLDNIYINLRTNKPVAVADYERAEKEKVQADSGRMSAPPDPVRKFDGLGAARIGGDLMIARWSIEALAHAVSIEDTDARVHLPTTMTVRAYESVLDGEDENEIKRAYRRRVTLDMTVLGGFSILFLWLTMCALKRKDVL
jgi:ABC-type multidrug transport system ATPase subunit/pSer/pThr/pTyr-binding forkhead associated (FHA) protein